MLSTTLIYLLFHLCNWKYNGAMVTTKQMRKWNEQTISISSKSCSKDPQWDGIKCVPNLPHVTCSLFLSWKTNWTQTCKLENWKTYHLFKWDNYKIEFKTYISAFMIGLFFGVYSEYVCRMRCHLIIGRRVSPFTL